MKEYLFQISDFDFQVVGPLEKWHSADGEELLALSQEERERAIDLLQERLYDRSVSFGEDAQGQYLMLKDRNLCFLEQYEAFSEALRTLSLAYSHTDFSEKQPEYAAADCGAYLVAACRKKEARDMAVLLDSLEEESIDDFLRKCEEKEKYYLGSAFLR